MTEKRFTIDVEEETNENAFFYGDKFICFEDDFDRILETFNVLVEGNEKLKEENQELTQKKNDLKELLMNSEPVLEQKELQKIIYKIVRDLIDNKLEESEEGFQQTYDSWYQGRIDALNELKKELDVV